MDIKSLLEEYAVIMDDMEAESGLNTVIEPEEKEEDKKEEKNESVNEEKDLAEKPAYMEQAEYKDMKIKEPEKDENGSIASKLLKQCEELEAVEEAIEETIEEVVESVDVNEEFKGEDFKHYSKFNKCKDVKEIKDLIKTIRDDIKDEDDKDKKAELKSDLNKAKNLLKAAQDLKKNETKIDEVSLDTAQFVNDKLNFDAQKKIIDMKKSDDPEDREIAKEAVKRAAKSNKLFKKWKKAKGIEESKKVGE